MSYIIVGNIIFIKKNKPSWFAVSAGRSTPLIGKIGKIATQLQLEFPNSAEMRK